MPGEEPEAPRMSRARSPARRLQAAVVRHRALLEPLAKATVPFLFAAAYAAYILLVLGDIGLHLLALLGGYLVPPLGKESVIPIGIFTGIPPLVMATSVAMVDVLVALFLVWNYPALYRIPILGKWVRKAEEKAKRKVEKGLLFRRLLFVGIVLLVVVPFQGSGAVTATILGRLVALGVWRTWIAIGIGAFLGSFLVAYSVAPFL